MLRDFPWLRPWVFFMLQLVVNFSFAFYIQPLGSSHELYTQYPQFHSAQGNSFGINRKKDPKLYKVI